MASVCLFVAKKEMCSSLNIEESPNSTVQMM